jgi:hypothetical protein
MRVSGFYSQSNPCERLISLAKDNSSIVNGGFPQTSQIDSMSFDSAFCFGKATAEMHKNIGAKYFFRSIGNENTTVECSMYLNQFRILDYYNTVSKHLRQFYLGYNEYALNFYHNSIEYEKYLKSDFCIPYSDFRDSIINDIIFVENQFIRCERNKGYNFKKIKVDFTELANKYGISEITVYDATDNEVRSLKSTFRDKILLTSVEKDFELRYTFRFTSDCQCYSMNLTSRIQR